MHIKILPSARKHGLTDDEIRHAATHIFCDKKKKRENNTVHFSIGILQNGKTCELIFFIEHFEEMVIFHAMSPARSSFINDVQKKRG